MRSREEVLREFGLTDAGVGMFYPGVFRMADRIRELEARSNASGLSARVMDAVASDNGGTTLPPIREAMDVMMEAPRGEAVAWAYVSAHSGLVLQVSEKRSAIIRCWGLDDSSDEVRPLVFGDAAPVAAVVTEAADLMPLARLGAWTLEHIRGDCAGDVGAFAVQDEAVKFGVIAPVPAPKPCGACCVCDEMDADTCYRDTDATNRARAALSAARGGA